MTNINIRFQNQQELENWLNVNGIQTDFWGENRTKSIAHLWQEYIRGEITFEADPPLRVVLVVQVIVRNQNRILIEAEQEFSNGERRSRNQMPSEKMKPGESVEETAVRCLVEELGVSPQQITFLPGGKQRQTVLLSSPSYPGLLTRYTFYTVETAVTGLPPHPFWQNNKGCQEGDPVCCHHWKWVDADNKSINP
ncbi:MAG: hypothetical protein Kow0080_34720 [Candidatus Promineifilaceae bacterium]